MTAMTTNNDDDIYDVGGCERGPLLPRLRRVAAQRRRGRRPLQHDELIRRERPLSS